MKHIWSGLIGWHRANRHTLNEWLLIACLAGVIVTALLWFIQPADLILQAQDNQRRTDLQRLQSALQDYAADHDGHYPVAGSAAGYYNCYKCGWSNAETDSQTGQPFHQNNWIPELVADGYIESLPVDPLGQVAPGCSSSGYIYLSGGVGYKVFNWCAPRTGLQAEGEQHLYCQRPPFDGTALRLTPDDGPSLQPFVDPARPNWGYAIYTFELACY